MYWSPALFDAIVVGMSKEIQKDICYQISKHGNPLSVYRWNWEIHCGTSNIVIGGYDRFSFS